MIGRCTIKLPFYWGGFIKIKIRRNIGFAFTNKMMWQMMERHPEFKGSFEKYSEYASKNLSAFALEMYYCAALAWCYENYKKPRFTEKSFFEAMSLLNKAGYELLSKTWGESELGAKDLGGKKKASANIL